MPRRDDLKRIVILGSGPIRIGQAAEFDFSGSQACRALRADGYEIILINSNPATIQNDPEIDASPSIVWPPPGHWPLEAKRWKARNRQKSPALAQKKVKKHAKTFKISPKLLPKLIQNRRKIKVTLRIRFWSSVGVPKGG